MTEVALRPEEAVLGGCKTATTSNTKNIGGSFTCTVPTACFDVTS